jgi:hypothetical protein
MYGVFWQFPQMGNPENRFNSQLNSFGGDITALGSSTRRCLAAATKAFETSLAGRSRFGCMALCPSKYGNQLIARQ